MEQKCRIMKCPDTAQQQGLCTFHLKEYKEKQKNYGKRLTFPQGYEKMGIQSKRGGSRITKEKLIKNF